MGSQLGTILALTALLGTGGCSSPPKPDEFQIGSTRGEIMEAHGPPVREQTFTNTGQIIWGAIEEFWPSVPRGGSVLIWAYPVEGGTLELYFIDGSTRVQGTGLAPEGAVFEGSGDR